MREIIRSAKKRLLQMHYDSGVGHIGCNLSALDVLMTLHHRILTPDDAFILSKGHAAGAMYITLWSLGKIGDDELLTFHKEATRLAGHPAPATFPDILFATGSLGHGLSIASGIALANRLQGKAGRVYCLTSDGEWQEGSTWEALIFAKHQKLPVTVIVDRNGLQGFGSTADVASMDDIASIVRGYGISVMEIDAHDPEAIESACREAKSTPTVIVANSQKGNGVSFMQNRMEWHYLPMDEEQFSLALQEIAALP